MKLLDIILNIIIVISMTMVIFILLLPSPCICKAQESVSVSGYVLATEDNTEMCLVYSYPTWIYISTF